MRSKYSVGLVVLLLLLLACVACAHAAAGGNANGRSKTHRNAFRRAQKQQQQTTLTHGTLEAASSARADVKLWSAYDYLCDCMWTTKLANAAAPAAADCDTCDGSGLYLNYGNLRTAARERQNKMCKAVVLPVAAAAHVATPAATAAAVCLTPADRLRLNFYNAWANIGNADTPRIGFEYELESANFQANALVVYDRLLAKTRVHIPNKPSSPLLKLVIDGVPHAMVMPPQYGIFELVFGPLPTEVDSITHVHTAVTTFEAAVAWAFANHGPNPTVTQVVTRYNTQMALLVGANEPARVFELEVAAGGVGALTLVATGNPAHHVQSNYDLPMTQLVNRRAHNPNALTRLTVVHSWFATAFLPLTDALPHELAAYAADRLATQRIGYLSRTCGVKSILAQYILLRIGGLVTGGAAGNKNWYGQLPKTLIHSQLMQLSAGERQTLATFAALNTAQQDMENAVRWAMAQHGWGSNTVALDGKFYGPHGHTWNAFDGALNPTFAMGPWHVLDQATVIAAGTEDYCVRGESPIPDPAGPLLPHIPNEKVTPAILHGGNVFLVMEARHGTDPFNAGLDVGSVTIAATIATLQGLQGAAGYC